VPDSIDDRLATAGLPPLPRGVWLEIDVAALTNNVEVFRESIGPGVNLGAVVKADGYGHGLKSVGLAFESAGADRLCVASLDEAVTLRKAGVTIPVLVLFSVPSDGVQEAARNRIDITASDLPTMDRTIQAWQHGGAGGALAVHVEIETGLTRAGVTPEQAPDLIRRLSDTPGVRLASVWTHLASPERSSSTA
jgi:alanine racemase